MKNITLLKFISSKIDPHSLQLRLTIGVAIISTLGLGSLAVWTSCKMQQILIDSHKHNIVETGTRFPDDVKLYSQMVPVETGLQKAIDNLTTADTFLWINSPDNKLIFKSIKLNSSSDFTAGKLIAVGRTPIKPKVFNINQHYFIVYSNALKINGTELGTLFVAQDMTRDQTMFLMMVQSLSIASILAILGIGFVIWLYIKYSLQPLRQLNQMTGVISLQDLGQANLSINNAPSEVKELAQTFNMMLSRLSQSWEQERQFVSNVSHELRTPLTIVHGYLQSVLRRETNLTDMQREALETAALEAQHTIHLLQDLLDLARADSGYLHFQMTSCVLNDLVIEVVEMANKYSERMIVIEATTYPIEVKADYSRLKQVLLNLIDNAVKYSEPDTKIILKLTKHREQATVEVCDRGYGIPLQHQSRIFERFYRVDETRNRATGGTGLGLSIVKTLIEGMGGSVAVRSRLNQGSIFTVTLSS